MSEWFTGDYFLLMVDATTDNAGLPGQFYHIQCSRDHCKLRVPISIYDTNKDTISFLIKIVGEKTEALTKKGEGSRVNIFGPLGNSFAYAPNKRYLLVSGGCGYAPLHYFHSYYPKQNMTWFHGCADVSETDFIDINQLHTLTTDNGSKGKKGYVTDAVAAHLSETSTKYDQVYACGPKPMLKALRSICLEFGLPLQVSLEAYMACGMGACHGCAVPTMQGYARVCKDGPIFEAKDIKWSEIL